VRLSDPTEITSAFAGLDLPRILDVLVIEDDFGDYDAAARAMRKMRHFEARSSRAKTIEAARLLMAQKDFDIFLIDYHLGADSGARILAEIAERRGRGVPILLTGDLEREVHEIALHAGAICSINKADLSPTVLESTFRSAMYTHRLEQKLSLLLAERGAQPSDVRPARSYSPSSAQSAPATLI
jgi:DNA-binding NarL/FixJ family response regulator